MSILNGSRILLGVTGSVAAFKAAALASELTKSGAEVRVILTSSGERFVTTETFRDLTGRPVSTSLWDAELDHIDLAKWAEVIVVAPATANIMAEMALGLTPDLLSTVLLAAACPIVVAPAMETHMWQHPATQAHVAALRNRGVEMIGPNFGRLASGEMGSGRMSEPAVVLESLNRLLNQGVSSRGQDLQGTRILVTAGPTQEPLDPVRFISNQSSGKMGYAIARAAASRGAGVTLISGPVDTAMGAGLPSDVRRIDVVTSGEMTSAVLSAAPDVNVVIMAAAVADFRPAHPSENKIKKTAGMSEVALEPTDDILMLLTQQAPHTIRVGFAAETTDVLRHANEKLARKGLAMIVANDVSGRDGGVFGADTNQVSLIRPDRDVENLERMSKNEVAQAILDRVADLVASGSQG